MRSSRSRRSPSPSPCSGLSSARRSALGSSPSRAASAGTSEPTPMFGGVGIFAGFVGRRAARAGDRRDRVERRARRDPRWRRAPVRRRPRRRPPPPRARSRSSRAQIAAAVIVLASGLCRSRSSGTTCSPGRSVSSGSSGSRTPSTCSTTWTASRRRSPRSRAATSRSTPPPSTRTTPSSCSRSRSASPASAFLPFNLRPGAARRSSWATRAARCSASGSPRSRSPRAGPSPERPSRRCSCRCSSSPIPILDTTLVTLVRLAQRRPVTQGGRDHTSHRLVYYGLSERSAVLLLAVVATALGATGARLQRPRRRAPDRDRRARDVRAARPVRQLPERPRGALARRAPKRARAAAVARARVRAAPPGGGVVDFVLICGSFLAAYCLVIGGQRNRVRALDLPLGAPDPARDAVLALRRARRLPARVALRDRARRRPDRGRVLRLGARRLPHPHLAARHRRLPARGLRRRRLPLHDPRRARRG